MQTPKQFWKIFVGGVTFYATMKAILQNLQNVSDRSIVRLFGVSRSAVKRARLKLNGGSSKRKLRKDKIVEIASPFLDAWWHSDGSREDTDSSHYIRVKKGQPKHHPRYQMDSMKHLWKNFKVLNLSSH